MLLNIYALRDNKCGLYQNISVQRHSPEVIRALEQAVNDPKNQIHHYAGDYDLYQLGTVDDESGNLIPLKPEFIVNAASLKATLHTQEKN